MSSIPPRPTLSEARAKLRELGYLQSRVERFVFRRALQGIVGLLLPVVFAGALAASLAETAAVAATQFRYGESPRAVALLFAHLFLAAVVPSAVFAATLFAAAGRSGRPGRGAAAFGLVASAGALFLWILGAWRLGPERAAAALVWGIPVCLAALLFGATTRATFLARAFARSGRLPERPRRAILLFAVAGAFSVAALLFAARREPARPLVLLPSPRSRALVVVAIDGLRLDAPEPQKGAIASLLATGATGWWQERTASPAEIWTDLATGMPAARHGVRALEWVRPFGLPALRPPFGTSWYLRGVGLAAGIVSRAPVSAWERRTLAFWEVAASAGLPSLSVGWWASGPWPGAEVVENREVLARSANGLEADAVAISEFERRANGKTVATVYLPGADILRDQPPVRQVALTRIRLLLDRLIDRARNGDVALVVLAVDTHPVADSIGRMFVFDGFGPPRMVRIQPDDVTPSLLARAGIPVARDLPGRAIAALFRPGSLETTAVATYGDRIVPAAAERPETDRDYLQKLKSLGYLN